MNPYSRNQGCFLQRDYDPNWSVVAKDAIEELQEALSGVTWLRSIEHIGSTSVPGLSAKPIVDIIIGYDAYDPSINNEAIELPMLALGYKTVDRPYFCKASCILRATAVSLCFCPQDGLRLRSRIAFRDYLRNNQKALADYMFLKQALMRARQYTFAEYTQLKQPFIVSILIKLGWTARDALDAAVNGREYNIVNV